MTQGQCVQEVPQVPASILEAADHGRLVVFVGAGVSRLAGLPSWRGFADATTDLLHARGVTSSADAISLKSLSPRQTLTIALNTLEDAGVTRREVLTRVFGRAGQSTAFESLLSFRAIYLTTNYDRCLEDAGRGQNAANHAMAGTPSSGTPPPTRSFCRNMDMLPGNLAQGAVLHLHGSVDEPDETVITLRDYFDCYRDDGLAVLLLRSIFSSYTVLFVGYGIDEYEIIDPLWSSNRMMGRKSDVKPHAMLAALYRDQESLCGHLSRYYSDLNIQYVPYSRSVNGHRQLERVLENWAGQIGPIARRTPTIDTLGEIDEVT